MARGRPAKPWYWEERGGWYANVGGRRVRLAVGRQSEAEAWAELRRLRQRSGRADSIPGTLSTRELFNCFLASVEAAVGRGERSPATMEGYLRLLRPAVVAFGTVPAADVTPYHVHRWLDATPWGPTTRCNGVVAVKAAFRWAKRSGLIGADPLAELGRPSPRKRSDFPDGRLIRAVLHAIDEEEDPLADVIRGLYLTGFRISELIGIRVRDLDTAGRSVEVRDKGVRGPGDRRSARHLAASASVFLASLAEGKELDDPLFANRRGRTWTRNAVNQAFIKFRHAVGLGSFFTPHAIRHRFGCDALGATGDASTVAALMGHRSVRMVNEVYGHWNRQGRLLGEAADRIRPSPPPRGDQRLDDRVK